MLLSDEWGRHCSLNLFLYLEGFLVLLNAFVEVIDAFVVERGHHIVVNLPSLFEAQRAVMEHVKLIIYLID